MESDKIYSLIYNVSNKKGTFKEAYKHSLKSLKFLLTTHDFDEVREILLNTLNLKETKFRNSFVFSFEDLEVKKQISYSSVKGMLILSEEGKKDKAIRMPASGVKLFQLLDSESVEKIVKSF
jgi:hypothetical protein